MLREIGGIEGLGIERNVEPVGEVPMIGMDRVAEGFEEVFVAPGTARVLRWARSTSTMTSASLEVYRSAPACAIVAA